jgi:SAM-dependent methyltransferase
VSSSESLLKSGDYARKQIFCRSRFVAWSHGSRFALACRLAAARGGRLLDYGCGDGTFIAMVHASMTECLGVDVDPAQVGECTRRLGCLAGVRFGLTTELQADGPAPAHAWSIVTCMEVLEHCLEAERLRVIRELARLAHPSGTVIVSVPIEVGPTIVGKQCARALAGWRGLGDYAYRERYTGGELLRAAAGLPVHRPSYEVDGPAGRYRYYGHKGFDYRDVERELAAHLQIVERHFTPLPVTGPLLNSQAWFVCRPIASLSVNAG